MGGSCSTHGRDKSYKTLDRSKELGVEGKILLEWILGK
jgi:hypothetical protein